MSTNETWGDLPPEEPLDNGPGDAPDDKPAADIDPEKAEWLSQPAPYGRFKNGKPRKSAPGGKRAKGAPRKAKAATQVGYEEGINGIFQMGAFALAMAGTNNKVMLADSLALTEHGPNIASALNMLAMERPEVAAVLDKVLAVGPYGALVAAVAPLALQVVANHGLKVPGAVGAEEYVANAEAKFMAAAGVAGAN